MKTSRSTQQSGRAIRVDSRTQIMGARVPKPSLVLDFVNQIYGVGVFGSPLVPKTLEEMVSVVRGSTAGCFNSAGVYEMLPANQLRLEFNPLTKACKGLLVEEARANIAFPSNAANTLTGTRATFVDTGELFIDKTSAFRLLRESTDSGTHFGLPATVPVAANSSYCFSYFVKPAGRTRLSLQVQNTTGWVIAAPRVDFDFNAKTFQSNNEAVGGLMEELGGGVWRVGLRAVTGAAGISTSCYPVLMNDAGVSSYVGDGVSGIHVGGYQCELGSDWTSYFPTTTAAATRAAERPELFDLAPWFNAEKGSFLASCITNQVNTARRPNILSLSTDGDNYMDLFHSGATFVRFLSKKTSVWLVDSRTTAGITNKVCARYGEGDLACASVGQPPVKNTFAKVPTVAKLRIGTDILGGSQLQGYMQSLVYYPTKLLDHQMRRLTA